jgi:hypothetical protein
MPIHNNLQQLFPTSKQSLKISMLYACFWRSCQRAFQMVNSTADIDNISLHLYRKHVSNTCKSLKDFNYNLGIGLLQSMSNPYFQNVLFSKTTRMQMITGTNNQDNYDD